MSRRKGLKGGGTARKVPLDRLLVGPNVRGGTVGDVNDLAESIRAHGLIHPLNVEAIDRDDGETRWLIVAGHRRYAALRSLVKAGDLRADEPIPVLVVQSPSEVARALRQIAENIGRQDVHGYQLACRLQAICDASPGLTHHELAKGAGISRSYVSKLLSAREKAIDPIRDYLERGVTDSRVTTAWFLRVCNQSSERQVKSWQEITGEAPKTRTRKSRGQATPKPETSQALRDLASEAPKGAKGLLREIAEASEEPGPAGQWIRWILGWGRAPQAAKSS